jgi:hypothetical protein
LGNHIEDFLSSITHCVPRLTKALAMPGYDLSKFRNFLVA